MKILPLSILAAALTLSSCQPPSSNQQSEDQREEPIFAEIQKQGRFLVVDDSWFSRDGVPDELTTIAEAKNPYLAFKTRDLTQADRMNGTSYLCEWKLTTSARRTCNFQSGTPQGWSRWYDPRENENPFSPFYLVKGTYERRGDGSEVVKAIFWGYGVSAKPPTSGLLDRSGFKDSEGE